MGRGVILCGVLFTTGAAEQISCLLYALQLSQLAQKL
jgi:hypothetical protein